VTLSEYIAIAHAFFDGKERDWPTACSTASPGRCAGEEL